MPTNLSTGIALDAMVYPAECQPFRFRWNRVRGGWQRRWGGERRGESLSRSWRLASLGLAGRKGAEALKPAWRRFRLRGEGKPAVALAGAGLQKLPWGERHLPPRRQGVKAAHRHSVELAGRGPPPTAYPIEFGAKIRVAVYDIFPRGFDFSSPASVSMSSTTTQQCFRK